MDKERSNLETKCENMMNIVVESRKRFGKMCVDYEQKSSLIENKILNLHIDAFSNYKFKPKQQIPQIENNDFKHLEDFSVELSERVKFIEELRKKLKNTQEVVFQLKADGLGRRLREPFTADVLLANAKSKKVS